MRFLRPHPKNTPSGFTLLEVLAVVVIVAILGAIAAPSWISYANRQRISAVESDLLQVFKQAQQDAIQERRDVTVTINTLEPLPTVDTDGFAQVIGPDELAPNTIDLTATDPQITFDYQGMTPGQNLPFVVKISPANSSAQQCVVVATILGTLKTARDAECDTLAL